MRILSQLEDLCKKTNRSPGKSYRKRWRTWNEKNKKYSVYINTSVVPNSESRENACQEKPLNNYMKSKIENFK